MVSYKLIFCARFQFVGLVLVKLEMPWLSGLQRTPSDPDLLPEELRWDFRARRLRRDDMKPPPSSSNVLLLLYRTWTQIESLFTLVTSLEYKISNHLNQQTCSLTERYCCLLHTWKLYICIEMKKNLGFEFRNLELSLKPTKFHEVVSVAHQTDLGRFKGAQINEQMKQV